MAIIEENSPRMHRATNMPFIKPDMSDVGPSEFGFFIHPVKLDERLLSTRDSATRITGINSGTAHGAAPNHK